MLSPHQALSSFDNSHDIKNTLIGFRAYSEYASVFGNKLSIGKTSKEV